MSHASHISQHYSIVLYCSNTTKDTHIGMRIQLRFLTSVHPPLNGIPADVAASSADCCLFSTEDSEYTFARTSQQFIPVILKEEAFYNFFKKLLFNFRTCPLQSPFGPTHRIGSFMKTSMSRSTYGNTTKVKAIVEVDRLLMITTAINARTEIHHDTVGE